MDPFVVLGLPPWASREDVRAAYRRLAPRDHPDRNPNDPDAARRFAALHSAYRAALAEVGEQGPTVAAAGEEPAGGRFEFAGRHYRRQADGGIFWWSERRDRWERVTDGNLPLAGHTLGRRAARVVRWWRS